MTPPKAVDRRSLAFLGTGVSIAVIVGAMAWGGHQLDELWGTHPWLLVTGVMVGFTISMLDLLRLVKHYEEQKKEDREG